jgi:hypothetical protein
MKKSIVVILFFLILFVSGRAQNTKDSIPRTDTLKAWKIKSLTTVTFAQTTYKYWSQGGENSLTAIANSKIITKYHKRNHHWDNIFEAVYGISQQGEKKIIKTDDKFEFTTNYAFRASDSWNYNMLINLKSQFMPGYKYPNDSTVVSDFFSPAYLITSVGLEFKRKSYYLVFSVLTGKTTFVTHTTLSDAGAYGVEKGKKLKAAIGSYVKFIFRKEVISNVELNSKLELFSEYFNQPQYIDVNWEVVLKMKINKFMSAMLNTNLIYDNDTKVIVKDSKGVIISSDAKVQFKETFGLGFTLDI